MNKVILIGRLTRDPQMCQTKDGAKYAKFTLAVDRPMTKDTSDFFDCSAFGKTADYIEKNLKKATKVCVEGIVFLYEFTKQDGTTFTRMSVTVNGIEQLTFEKKADSHVNEDDKEAEAMAEDLPF